MVYLTIPSVEVIITVWVVINPYHLLIASQSVCHESAIAVCMNILLVLFANTIPTLFVYNEVGIVEHNICLLYTSPSPRDRQKARMPSSA